ncbi:phosphodiester glycosidase family protein [Streptomyces sp. NPDC053493]|uniref:phosphodiester glycosidase family protein n=1 Tax=Streptomyces sp. NPDC053493 TaxID=3365705 RepID=UPI0037CD2E91
MSGTGSGTRSRTVVVLLLAWCVLAVGLAPGAAGATGRAAEVWQELAPGVAYRALDMTAAHGPVRVHLLAVDLRADGVDVDLLHPGVVAARAPLSGLADARGALAAVNGDFFHVSETQHPGVEATGAPVGPAVAGGRELKAAVPRGQRFGPALPPGTGTLEVFGVGMDHRARTGRLVLDGSVTGRAGSFPLGGLNQYALPVGSVGVFTAAWGGASRARAVCGTDTDRAAPCTTEAYEVTVRRGRVVAVADAPGRGPVAADTEVLVGREEGARRLRGLAVGDRVRVRHRLVAEGSSVPYRFAVGGCPLVRDGAPLPGLDGVTPAVRTAVGITHGGRGLLLMALDGSPGLRVGMTVAEVAALLREQGAREAFGLDGGGSSTLVGRAAGEGSVTVRNHPSGGAERPVPNGIGVLVRR